ncbi:unnamed protein product [Strongylus vulgaris]|uniref:Uncharacterized protein n=1 Tax=Strongylus vulgaris TaxID=40348 RepID=A0A3P7ITN3_STRVU|nr:unnamed protein product [Strongylus vulgaris]
MSCGKKYIRFLARFFIFKMYKTFFHSCTLYKKEVKYQEKVLGHHNEVTFDLMPFALAGYMALESLSISAIESCEETERTQKAKRAIFNIKIVDSSKYYRIYAG